MRQKANQLVRHSRHEDDHYAERHPAGSSHAWRACLSWHCLSCKTALLQYAYFLKKRSIFWNGVCVCGQDARWESNFVLQVIIINYHIKRCNAQKGHSLPQYVLVLTCPPGPAKWDSIYHPKNDETKNMALTGPVILRFEYMAMRKGSTLSMTFVIVLHVYLSYRSLDKLETQWPLDNFLLFWLSSLRLRWRVPVTLCRAPGWTRALM